MICTVLVRIGKQGNRSVILLHVRGRPFPCLNSHVNASQLEAHIIRRFDRVILTPNPVQVVQDVLPRGHGRPGVSPSLDEHLLELHEHVRVEVSQSQNRDDRGHRGRRTALLLQTLLRDVERLRDERRELVVDHPPHRGNVLRSDAHHVHGVLHRTDPPDLRRIPPDTGICTRRPRGSPQNDPARGSSWASRKSRGH